MNKIIIFLTSILVTIFSTSESIAKSTGVRGYTRKNGTYVQGHRRSAADSNKFNNWSKRGNTNPYTGKRGSK